MFWRPALIIQFPFKPLASWLTSYVLSRMNLSNYACIYEIAKISLQIDNNDMGWHLSRGRWGNVCKSVLLNTCYEFSLWAHFWKIPREKPTLVQVMALRNKAASNYLRQNWPSLWRHIPSLGHTDLNTQDISVGLYSLCKQFHSQNGKYRLWKTVVLVPMG